MSLRLYNTLTRKVEPFVPLRPGRVTLYTCGPTVYNYAHIGNFRTFLFEDLLRRWLEASGYDVFHVMNLTDVDDKTIAGALAAGQPLRTHVQRYIEAFHEDRRYLRIADASVYPRATEYIPAMIRLVEGLLAKGVAYRAEDGSVYFAIARFPAYGRLSRLDQRELKAGASERVSADEYAKDDVRDFAKARLVELGWFVLFDADSGTHGGSADHAAGTPGRDKPADQREQLHRGARQDRGQRHHGRGDRFPGRPAER